MDKGFLIAFEGVDGAGKKTLSRYMANQLKRRHLRTRTFDYPDYKSPWGKIIKKYLYSQIELNLVEQFLTFFTDIYKDQAKIKALISEGIFVIVNRYFASTVAFQCAKGFSYKRALDIFSGADIIIPDISFFLKVDPNIALERCSERGILDRHEKDTELLKKVSFIYERIIERNQLSHKWIIIDSTKSLDFLKKEINNYIDLILKGEM